MEKDFINYNILTNYTTLISYPALKLLALA